MINLEKPEPARLEPIKSVDKEDDKKSQLNQFKSAFQQIEKLEPELNPCSALASLEDLHQTEQETFSRNNFEP